MNFPDTHLKKLEKKNNLNSKKVGKEIVKTKA